MKILVAEGIYKTEEELKEEYEAISEWHRFMSFEQWIKLRSTFRTSYEKS